MTESSNAWYTTWGLTNDPFGISDKPFYSGGQRQEIIESIRHLIHFSNRILLLIGDKGSGKTFLVDQLCHLEKDSLKLIVIKPKLLQDSYRLVGQLTKSLELPSSEGLSNVQVIENIVKSCESRYENGFRTFFVVDDAQDLSDESLSMLVSLIISYPSSSYGILLVAQPQIENQISKLFSKSEQGRFHHLNLRNLNLEESTEYVEAYLANACAKVIPFTEAQKKTLFEVGKGIPGRINRLVGNVMLSHSIRDVSKEGIVLTKGKYISGAVAVLIVAFLFVTYLYKNDTGQFNETKRTVKLEIDLTSPSVVQDVTNQSKSLPSPLDKGFNVELDKSKGEAIFKEVESPLNESSALDIKAGPKLEQKTVKVEQGLLPPKKANGKASERGSVKESQEDPGEVDTEDRVQSKVDSGSIEKSNQVINSKANQKSTPLTKNRTKGLKTQQWLDQQAKGSWTIQILGSIYEDTASKYLRDNQLDDNYYYVKSRYQGKDWFVVLHGVYQSKEKARAALAKLPAKIRKSGPWIRSIKGLQSRQ